VRREDQRGVVGNLVDLFDEPGALVAQLVDDVAVVDDLLANVDRAVEDLERFLDHVDRTDDARAEPTQTGDQKLLDPDAREIGGGLRHQFTVSANFSFLRGSGSGAAVGKERARSGNFA
jgi:hypothetical protein